jgi:hypothetical protein
VYCHFLVSNWSLRTKPKRSSLKQPFLTCTTERSRCNSRPAVGHTTPTTRTHTHAHGEHMHELEKHTYRHHPGWCPTHHRARDWEWLVETNLACNRGWLASGNVG